MISGSQCYWLPDMSISAQIAGEVLAEDGDGARRLTEVELDRLDRGGIEILLLGQALRIPAKESVERVTDVFGGRIGVHRLQQRLKLLEAGSDEFSLDIHLCLS